jgi:hypothetical protein
MKRKLAAMVVTAMAMAAVAAGPASADDFDGDDLLFFGYPTYSVVDDVDYENVRERNPRDGECFVEDVDLDGFIAEYEIVCYR